MSGRLVILRHKSWHVWNQDNRERVLRDERLHREEVEQKEKEEKEKIRERNFAVLNDDKEQESKQAVLTESTDLDPIGGDEFNQLIKRIEVVREKRKEVSPHAHPEFIKEKEQAELKRKKREGLDDWQLGKGYFESQGSKLWYNQTGGKEQATAPAKVTQYHRSHDPMQKYMVHHDVSVIESKDQDVSSSSKVQTAVDTAVSAAGLLDDRDLSSASSDDSNNKIKKKKSSSNKHKKHKHKHDHKHKDRAYDEKDSKSTDHIQPNKHAISSHDNKQTMLEALRQKRLDREKTESKRAAMLLAEADIYGSHAAVGQGRAYSQQYNPNLARNR
ncbi:hypothetical protein EON65_30965 [archaeon]|nr:MAG: hypothetical protein EON65_30965 [archaeon]